MLFQSKVLLALQRRFFGIFSRNEETFRGAHIRSKVNNCRRVKLQLIHHFASSWCNPIHLLRVCRKRRSFCRVARGDHTMEISKIYWFTTIWTFFLKDDWNFPLCKEVSSWIKVLLNVWLRPINRPVNYNAINIIASIVSLIKIHLKFSQQLGCKVAQLYKSSFVTHHIASHLHFGVKNFDLFKQSTSLKFAFLSEKLEKLTGNGYFKT